ncbi:LmeA family phospholipid-binding protein [Mycobacterium sp. 852013-51886_SCH5428379]|uniref:LmeA family phospholipid-binding protein n=1 Tax=Mycobacterium sp. 852013-51886_SCH5428379 TaxID=1834111 RepID=UPI0009EE2FD9|nr:LmeA family phospholipid-binding protein [Mycobacterium sp. 852013-51886_SCH5428379]
MTRPGPQHRWELLGVLRTLFVTLPRLVVSRRVTLQLDDGELRATVTAFDPRPDLRKMPGGRFGDVRITARDIEWNDSRFERADVVFRDLQLRPTTAPALSAAPVEATVHVHADALLEVFRWAAPRLAGEVGADAVARLRWARRPGLGDLEVDARLDGATLCLHPRAVTMGRRRWELPARTPAYRVPLPELPSGLELTRIEFAPDVVAVTATLPSWQLAMPRTRIEQFLSQLRFR